jgi:DNA-binding transcriptional ArsR family regulator
MSPQHEEPVTAGDASGALDALGDANRRAIVQILSAGGHSVQEIADQLPISRPAVSRHLRLLKSAGLVDDRPDGTRHIYELRGEGVDAIRAYFADVWANAATRFRIVAENTDPPDD